MSARADTSSSSAQAGFTIIEMIVALFLFALAMAAVMPALGNMLDLGNRGAANAQASRDSSYALQVVEADLRRAEAARGNGSFERNSGDAASVNVVTALSTNGRAGRINHDIVSAGPQRLQLWSDVLGTSPGPELVTYALHQPRTRTAPVRCDRQARSSWCVIRTVQAAGRQYSEVIAHGAGTFPQDRACIPSTGGVAPAPATRLFCYQHKAPVAWRHAWSAWTPSCVASWAPPPAAISPNWNATTVDGTVGRRVPTFHDRLGGTSIWPLDTISAIGIVLPAGGRTDGARGLTTSVTTVDLRNRSTEDYLSAIQCGAR